MSSAASGSTRTRMASACATAPSAPSQLSREKRAAMAASAAASPTATAAAAPPAGVTDGAAVSARSSRTRRSSGSGVGHLPLEVDPEARNEDRIEIVALGRKRCLQVGDEPRAELGVGAGTLDDVV